MRNSRPFSDSALQTPRDGPLRHPPTGGFPRYAVLLVSWLSTAPPAFSHPCPDDGSYPFPDGGYPNPAAVYGTPYGDSPLGFPAGNRPYPRGELPDRAFEGYRRDPCRAPGSDIDREPTPGGDFRSAPPSEGRAHSWAGSRHWNMPETRTPGCSSQAPVAGELPLVPARGYRFRDGMSTGYADQGATPWRNAYRFRPLTEQERRRMGAETGWRPRPRVAAPDEGRLRRADPLSAEEAYGYQPESWFRRYFGDNTE